MTDKLAEIDGLLQRIERLAVELRADPGSHVRRSAGELREAFTMRGPLEPAVARMRDSVQMLRRGNRDEARREFHRRAQGLDHLDETVEQELVPHLRQIGFDV
jgi:hypothetical protein